MRQCDSARSASKSLAFSIWRRLKIHSCACALISWTNISSTCGFKSHEGAFVNVSKYGERSEREREIMRFYHWEMSFADGYRWRLSHCSTICYTLQAVHRLLHKMSLKEQLPPHSPEMCWNIPAASRKQSTALFNSSTFVLSFFAPICVCSAAILNKIDAFSSAIVFWHDGSPRVFAQILFFLQQHGRVREREVERISMKMKFYAMKEMVCK
jgi:hypothetical protein